MKHRLKTLADALKSAIDVGPGLRRAYHDAQGTAEFDGAFSGEPLVSICVGTYNRAELLTTRCLASLLAQTYRNLDIVVVGDACTDDTEERVRALRDRRIRFVNLPVRGPYPSHPKLRWFVAGTASINAALALSRGTFITHLDDDDEHAPDRVEKLLRFAIAGRYAFVWHPFFMQNADGRWTLRDCPRFEKGGVTTSSVFYHHWFRRLPWNPRAYRFYEPGDWNRFRRFRALGVRAARYPEALLHHYRERLQAPAATPQGSVT